MFDAKKGFLGGFVQFVGQNKRFDDITVDILCNFMAIYTK